MRAFRTLAVVIAAGLTLTASTTQASSKPNVPSLTVRAAMPQGYGHGFACWALPLETAQQIMEAPALQAVDTAAISTDDVYNCLYRDESDTLVGIMVHTETPGSFEASYKEIVRMYDKNKDSRYYRNAYVVKIDVANAPGFNGAVSAFFVHSAKYGHDLLFLNDGMYTVRLRVNTFTGPRGQLLAAAVVSNLKRFH